MNETPSATADKSRHIWLRWKESRKDGFWGPGLAAPKAKKQTASLDPRIREWDALAREFIAHPPTGTINCIDANGNISGVTTTNYDHNKDKLSKFYVNFYALNKQGIHDGAGLWSHYARTDASKSRVKYAVNDGGESRLVEAAYLYES